MLEAKSIFICQRLAESQTAPQVSTERLRSGQTLILLRFELHDLLTQLMILYCAHRSAWILVCAVTKVRLLLLTCFYLKDDPLSSFFPSTTVFFQENDANVKIIFQFRLHISLLSFSSTAWEMKTSASHNPPNDELTHIFWFGLGVCCPHGNSVWSHHDPPTSEPVITTETCDGHNQKNKTQVVTKHSFPLKISRNCYTKVFKLNKRGTQK